MPLKGSSFSAEATEKMRLSKFKRELSLYDWNRFEPYLDAEMNIGARNRHLIFFSPRQFKEATLNGQTIKQLRLSGVCKHLLQFYSNYLKGKIKLTQEELNSDYESGLSLECIAQKHSITRSDITFLRQMYGIKNKGPTFIHRKLTEIPLTQRQKEILYGSLMGDAKRMSPSAVGFGHGTHQREYLLWKYQEFESVASKNSFKITEYVDKRSGNHLSDARFYTHANTDIETAIGAFYKNGSKQVSIEVLVNLTPLSVAVWFMDDGKCDHNHRAIVKHGWNISPVFTFCTESFSHESCLHIQQWFKERFDIKVRLKEKKLSNSIGYRVIVDIEDNEKFVNLIRPFVLPMFLYKIDYGAYLDRLVEKNRDKMDAATHSFDLD